MYPDQLGLAHMIFKEASSLAASLEDWGGAGALVGCGPPRKQGI